MATPYAPTPYTPAAYPNPYLPEAALSGAVQPAPGQIASQMANPGALDLAELRRRSRMQVTVAPTASIPVAHPAAKTVKPPLRETIGGALHAVRKLGHVEVSDEMRFLHTHWHALLALALFCVCQIMTHTGAFMRGGDFVLMESSPTLALLVPFVAAAFLFFFLRKLRGTLQDVSSLADKESRNWIFWAGVAVGIVGMIYLEGRPGRMDHLAAKSRGEVAGWGLSIPNALGWFWLGLKCLAAGVVLGRIAQEKLRFG